VETLFLTKKKFKQPLFIQGKINLSLPRSWSVTHKNETCIIAIIYIIGGLLL
jgi:hypothetical protein